jgi:hypothetical protein
VQSKEFVVWQFEGIDGENRRGHVAGGQFGKDRFGVLWLR